MPPDDGRQDGVRGPTLEAPRRGGGPLVWIVLPFVAAYLAVRGVLRLVWQWLGRAWMVLRVAIPRWARILQSFVARLGRAVLTSIEDVGDALGRLVVRAAERCRAVARAIAGAVGAVLHPVADALAALALRVRSVLALLLHLVARPVRAAGRLLRAVAMRLGLVLRGAASAVADATRAAWRLVREFGARTVIILKFVAHRVALPIRAAGRALRELAVRLLVLLRAAGDAVADGIRGGIGLLRAIGSRVVVLAKALAHQAARPVRAVGRLLRALAVRALELVRAGAHALVVAARTAGHAVGAAVRSAGRLVVRMLVALRPLGRLAVTGFVALGVRAVMLAHDVLFVVGLVRIGSAFSIRAIRAAVDWIRPLFLAAIWPAVRLMQLTVRVVSRSADLAARVARRTLSVVTSAAGRALWFAVARAASVGRTVARAIRASARTLTAVWRTHLAPAMRRAARVVVIAAAVAVVVPYRLARSAMARIREALARPLPAPVRELLDAVGAAAAGLRVALGRARAEMRWECAMPPHESGRRCATRAMRSVA